MATTFQTLVIAAAAAAVGSIVAAKFSGGSDGITWGGSQPRQAGFTHYPRPLPENAAPLAQAQPITEAAYTSNTDRTPHQPAFGPDTNQNTGGHTLLTV